MNRTMASIFLIGSLTACSDGKSVGAAQEKEIADLRDQLNLLRAELSTSKSEAFSDHLKVEYLFEDPVVALDPSTQTFQIYKGEGFSFAISVQSVRDQADGSVAMINFGNLTGASIQNASVHLKYGARKPSKVAAKDLEQWRNSLHESDYSLTCRLSSGSWNPCAVTLPGVKSSELGYLEISNLSFNQIYLRSY